MADKTVGIDVLPAGIGLPVKYVDQGDGTFALKVATTGGGGGGGSSLSDVLLTDSNGILFIGRDSGGTSGTIFTYYRLDTQVAYTPVGTIKAAGNNVVTVADGADVTQGAIADAAVAAGAAGTESAKVRAISRDIGSVAAGTPSTLGQHLMAASTSVAIASDQGAIPVTGSVSTTAPTDSRATGNVTVINANGNVGAGTAGSYVALTGLNSAGTLTVQVTGTWTGTLQVQANVDGNNWNTLGIASAASSNPGFASTSISSASVGLWMAAVPSMAQVRVIATSAMTGTAVVSLDLSPANASTIGWNQGINLAQLAGGQAASVANAGGSSVRLLGAHYGAPATISDYTSQAWAATSGNGATIVDSDGIGSTCAFDINLATFTAGSSTGLDIFLQWSPDGGTTWYDLWQCEALTAAGHVFIPPLYMPGRRRMRWVNRGGAATTATVSVTATRLSGVPAKVQRQWFDRTAGVLSGTASAVTAWYDVAGCTSIAAYVPLGVASGPAQYQIQLSADGVNALPAGAAAAAVASTTTAYAANAGMVARFARIAVTAAATSQTAATIPVVITGS